MGDEISRTGFDGDVVSLGTHPFIPEGHSVWEMGVGDPSDKSSDDYRRRTSNTSEAIRLDTTFVFITPHEWSGKDGWLKRRRSRREWKNIVALDDIDLSTWLEGSPSTQTWLLSQFDQPVDDLQDIDLFFTRFNAFYGVEIKPRLIIGGREKELSSIQTWFRSGGTSIDVEADSVEEASAFIASAVTTLADDTRAYVESRLIFAASRAAVAVGTNNNTTAFVVPTTDEARLRIRELRRETVRSLIPTARKVGQSPGRDDVVSLGFLHREPCEQVLRELGIESHRAERAVVESKGRLAPLLWTLARDLHRPPEWTKPEVAHDLIPLLLAGQWDANKSTDQLLLSELSGKEASELERTLLRWMTPAGPLVKRGEIWDWLASDYAWSSLSSLIGGKDIGRFIDTATKALYIRDPSLDLDPGQRWSAGILGKSHPYSQALRAGLVGTIIHIALDVKQVDSVTGQEIASGIVRGLLCGEAVASLDRFLSLAHWLPDLAEAAPDIFLQAIAALARDEEYAKRLFIDGGLFGSSPHVPLLWALERLAWNERYFSLTTHVLAALAKVDPGGQLGNRPHSSLVEIFLPWLPQTQVGLAGRIDTLDALYSQYPDVVWKVCERLLPGQREIATPTAKPMWRDWKRSAEPVLTGEYWQFEEALIGRMLNWAGISAERWKTLVHEYVFLLTENEPLALKIRKRLLELSLEDLGKEGGYVISEELRELLLRYEAFPGAGWAMDEDKLALIEEVYNHIRPTDIVDQNRWLFSRWPTIPSEEKLSYEERFARLATLRTNAVREIWRSGELSLVLKLGSQVDAVEEVGRALASIGIDPDSEGVLIETTLSVEPTKANFPSQLLIGVGYISTAFSQGGTGWLDMCLSNKAIRWDALRYSNLALGLPPQVSTWRTLSDWGGEAKLLYWERAAIPFLHNRADVEYAVQELLNAGRPYRALMIAGMAVHTTKAAGKEQLELPVPANLAARALTEGSAKAPGEEWFAPDLNSIRSDIESLFDALESSDYDRKELLNLEWSWLALLENTKRGPKALHRTLTESPEFFVELLTAGFHGEGDKRRELSEHEKAHARHAYRVLHEWHQVPGSDTREAANLASNGDINFAEGTVNEEQLSNWVARVRELAAAKGRLAICDHQIGNVLAYAPKDPDGTWPTKPVRNLLERTRSKDIDSGVIIGVRNKRGAYFRGKGGDQERALRDKFNRYAELARNQFPFTAVILDEIAQGWDRDAKRADERDQIEEFE